MDFFQPSKDNLEDYVVSQLHSSNVFTRSFYDLISIHLDPFIPFMRPYSPPTDHIVISNLAKQFTPFLNKPINALPSFITKSPKLTRKSAYELLYILSLCVDCFEVIAPVFGDLYAAVNYRDNYISCLKHWELHDEAISESFVSLASLNRILKLQVQNWKKDGGVKDSESGIKLEEMEDQKGTESVAVNEMSKMDMLNPEVQEITVTTTQTTQSTITRTEEATERSFEVVSEKMLTEVVILEDKDDSKNQANGNGFGSYSEFIRDFIFPCLSAAAIYERKYLLGTSMARPVIAKAIVDTAKEVGADAVSHGYKGKGNDQVRFELTFFALNPELSVVAEQWKDLKVHVEDFEQTHLRMLMNEKERCEAMRVEFDGMSLDFSRQRATVNTMDKLYSSAKATHLKEKIDRTFNGERINSTKDKVVLHIALRAPRDSITDNDGKNVVSNVWRVLDKIKDFSEKIRSGAWVGATGKVLKNVVAVGGNFLDPLFVHTALQTDQEVAKTTRGRQLRFLANVDTIDVARNIRGMNPETTVVIVVSKTFTTAETRLNARTLREWISATLGLEAVSSHMVAVSTNLTLVKKFGIDPNNAFAFWDWLGGRYRVCSAAGVLPLSLQYGFKVVEKFLKGVSSIDQPFRTTPFEKNLPELLGLLSVCNVSFLRYPARAILPYSQALDKFAPYIQQVSRESNGNEVSVEGIFLSYEAGEIDFGEPGTIGQHSFYQPIHQDRVSPCDFIGIMKSQQPVYLKGGVVINHDELMTNFFTQPDFLAYGKTPEQLLKENFPSYLVTHKTFSDNRSFVSILLPSLHTYNLGQLLEIYEHRITVKMEKSVGLRMRRVGNLAEKIWDPGGEISCSKFFFFRWSIVMADHNLEDKVVFKGAAL